MKKLIGIIFFCLFNIVFSMPELSIKEVVGRSWIDNGGCTGPSVDIYISVSFSPEDSVGQYRIRSIDLLSGDTNYCIVNNKIQTTASIFLDPGVYNLLVEIDCDNNVKEVDEANNTVRSIVNLFNTRAIMSSPIDEYYLPFGRNRFAVLPGERFISPVIIFKCLYTNCQEANGIVGYKVHPSYSFDPMTWESIFDSVGNISAGPIIDTGHSLIRESYYLGDYMVLPKSSSVESLDSVPAFIFDLTATTSSKDTQWVILNSDVGLDSQEEVSISYGFEFYYIDNQIRGDVNGDSMVNSEDLKSFVKYVGDINIVESSSYQGRYTDSGLNYGRLILPGHSMPTSVVGPALLNIWLNNQSDPAVKDIGFGKIIGLKTLSKHKSSMSVPVFYEIVGNKLIVKTSPKAAINVYFFQGCKIWQKDGFADASGEWEVLVPDSDAKYTVEVCELCRLSDQTEIFLKKGKQSRPFVNSASRPGAVYDLSGRKMATVNPSRGLRILHLPNGKTVTNLPFNWRR